MFDLYTHRDFYFLFVCGCICISIGYVAGTFESSQEVNHTEHMRFLMESHVEIRQEVRELQSRNHDLQLRIVHSSQLGIEQHDSLTDSLQSAAR